MHVSYSPPLRFRLTSALATSLFVYLSASLLLNSILSVARHRH
jgi:hypothetical protein